MTRNNSKAQLWASRFAQFENSNLSVAQFCQSIDCSVGSFDPRLSDKLGTRGNAGPSQADAWGTKEESVHWA
jgi:hypothetical protein